VPDYPDDAAARGPQSFPIVGCYVSETTTPHVSDWCREGLQEDDGWDLEVVKREPGTRGFSVQPCRWSVERSSAWLIRNRRLAKDCARMVQTSETLLEVWAHVQRCLDAFTIAAPFAYHCSDHSPTAGDGRTYLLVDGTCVRSRRIAAALSTGALTNVGESTPKRGGSFEIPACGA